MAKVVKTEEQLKAIKRQGYFKRVKKRLQHRNAVDIDKSHPKYLFTQYIRISLRRLLANPTITKVLVVAKRFFVTPLKGSLFICS